jgi:GT2 family glycosyltransferase
MSCELLVYAVVLAWNQVSETLECLESLRQSKYPELKILLVDNGSTDGTSEIVAKQFPMVEISRVIENIGIARGYNLGLRTALERGADYVLAMNNDTIVDTDTVTELVKAIIAHPEAGMVSPKIYQYYGEEGRIWCVGAKWTSFPPRIKLIGSNVPDGPAYEDVMPLEYVTSCCLLMSAEALEAAGLFDPHYYFYFDDWDLSARFRGFGYEILFVPRARLWHKVSMSTQKSEKPAKWWYVMGRSSVRFYLQHKSGLLLASFTIWFVIREIAKLKLRRIPPYLFGVANGLADHWGWKPT